MYNKYTQDINKDGNIHKNEALKPNCKTNEHENL